MFPLVLTAPLRKELQPLDVPPLRSPFMPLHLFEFLFSVLHLRKSKRPDRASFACHSFPLVLIPSLHSLQKYEPWMDLPRASLSTEQRKLMAELEKRAMELMEECEKATRQLEMERKTVEVRGLAGFVG
eukprot:1139077-Pelagomonas_calceolata.AAC.19